MKKFVCKIEEVAAAQLLEAALWYNEKRLGLGDELIASFEAALLHLSQNPLYEVRYKNLRLYNIKRFPYQLIYRVEKETIEVLAFFHAHRDPEVWRAIGR